MSNLEYRNNWESDEYRVDGKRVLNLTTVSINDAFYPVNSRMVSVVYNDMGHNYTANSKHYFVTSKDLNVEVDLNRLVNKNDIVAVNYEVE